MNDELEELRERVEHLESELKSLRAHVRRGVGVRKRSEITVLGMPLYDIATGPDPAAGEIRGHARGVIAIGDIATGVLAFGGAAFGLVAVGGLAVGGICIGGCAIGLLLGVGGVATGALALGGLAIGWVACGGMAVGHYACGGDALGEYVLSAKRQDREAVELFGRWIPGIDQWVGRGAGR